MVAQNYRMDSAVNLHLNSTGVGQCRSSCQGLYILAVLDLLHHQEILLVIAFKLHQPRSLMHSVTGIKARTTNGETWWKHGGNLSQLDVLSHLSTNLSKRRPRSSCLFGRNLWTSGRHLDLDAGSAALCDPAASNIAARTSAKHQT